MGKFDKYVKRFDELDAKKPARGDPAPGARPRNPWVQRAWLGALGLSLLAAGAIYGPSLAGASGVGNPDVSGDDADRDYRSLRSMTFQQVQQVQKDRMDILFRLTQSKAPAAEIEAANQAAFRVNKVARELNPD